MSVRMRHTRGHTGNRRSHHALKTTTTVVDKESGNIRLPHRLDEVTGMYRGKQIAPARTARLSKKDKNKAMATASNTVHEHSHEEHAVVETKTSKGIIGKLTTGGKPKARSGFGGGA